MLRFQWNGEAIMSLYRNKECMCAHTYVSEKGSFILTLFWLSRCQFEVTEKYFWFCWKNCTTFFSCKIIKIIHINKNNDLITGLLLKPIDNNTKTYIFCVCVCVRDRERSSLFNIHLLCWQGLDSLKGTGQAEGCTRLLCLFWHVLGFFFMVGCPYLH